MPIPGREFMSEIEGLVHAVKVHGAHVSCRNKVLLWDGEWRVFKRIESETTGALEDIFWYPDFPTEEAAVAELTCVR